MKNWIIILILFIFGLLFIALGTVWSERDKYHSLYNLCEMKYQAIGKADLDTANVYQTEMKRIYNQLP